MKLKIILAIVALLLVIQLIPVQRDNPPVTQEIVAPAEVKAFLRRSCYDCHSNETKWPWYSYVAPVSWLVAHDVHEGREELNFSEMDRYSERRKKRKLKKALEEIEEGEMPLWFYIPLHPDARVTRKDIDSFKAFLGSL